MKRIPETDLQDILNNTQQLWSNVNGKTFFITGGTGFFGKWLVGSFVYINQQLGLNNKMIVLTRNAQRFLADNPWLTNQPALKFITGDVRDFAYPDEDIDYIIHAATEASVALNIQQPLLMYDTITKGTKNVLEFARVKKVKAVLHTSSGAVYGKQPSAIEHITESFMGSPDIFNDGAAYGEGKRVAEMMAAIYYKKHQVPSKIARCYALAGPYLPLDGSFAFGNFISNAIANLDIHINGDGTPFRSYMYASDLAIWLYTILFNGEPCRPYNVGSDEGITIAQLAQAVAASKKNAVSVKIAHQPVKDAQPQRYVPSIDRAKDELGLKIKVSLAGSIEKTMAFYQ